jgi:hypothetical protein
VSAVWNGWRVLEVPAKSGQLPILDRYNGRKEIGRAK